MMYGVLASIFSTYSKVSDVGVMPASFATCVPAPNTSSGFSTAHGKQIVFHASLRNER